MTVTGAGNRAQDSAIVKHITGEAVWSRNQYLIQPHDTVASLTFGFV